ncbi:MAG: peptidylprolyl isomerase [Lachnospiraceae bacterium]|nr:peptidylprolyl isomerase [Lachnospiraceae bacterium]
MKKNIYFLKGLLLLLAVTMTVCGCQDKGAKDGEGTKIVLTTGFEANEIFRIEKSSCELSEVMVYLMNTKNQYEEIFGEEIWNTSHEGVTLEENIKETVLAKLAKIKAMNLLAQQKGIALDEDEKGRIMQAAQEYYASLNEAELAGLAVTLEKINAMYEEYALADKVYEHLIADINPEISDDEARTITVQHILIKTYSLNEDGEKVPYTEQAKRQAYQQAREIWQKAMDGEDFASLITEYSEDSSPSYSFGKGSLDAAFEEAAFNLGTDEISSVVESASGYHIIKCISTFDREETDRNKIKIVEQRRKEVFDEEYTKFVNGLTRNLNTELWETVGFLEGEGIVTSSFFETFHKYF